MILLHLHVYAYSFKQIIQALEGTLLQSLQQQFAFVFHRMETGFDGIYLAATLLNPSYRKLLNKSEVTIAAKFLLAMMSSNTETENLSGTSMSQSQSQDFAEIIEPPKRFKHLDLVSELLDSKEKESNEPVALPKEGMDIERYLKTIPSKADLQLDPIENYNKQS